MAFNLSVPTTAKVPPFSFTSTSTPSSTAATNIASGFTFGGNKTTAPTGVAFGTATTATAPTAAAPTGFSFGSTAPTGTAIAAPQPALTATTTTTATTQSFGFGGAAPTTGFGLPVSSNAPAATGTGFGFGSVAVSKPAVSTGFSFGLTAPQPTSTTGLGGPASGFAFSTTTSAQTNPAPAFKGLGGVNPTEVSGSSSATGATTKSSDGKRGKETEIPAEVANTVEAFKKSLVEQKNTRDALSKHTDRPFQKVREDLNLLKSQLVEITNNTSRNSCQIKKLKADIVEENKNVLIARRTFETPPALQFENTAPIIYFSRVLQDFESRLINYKQEIENVEGLLATSDAHNAVPPQELYQTLKRLHDGFIVVASDLYTVHDLIRKMKTTYLKYRRLLGDTYNPFPAETGPTAGAESGTITRSSPCGRPTAPGGSSGTLSAPTNDSYGDLPSLDPQRLFNTWMGIGSVAPTPGAASAPQSSSNPASTTPTAHGLLQGALTAAVSGGAPGTAPGSIGAGGSQIGTRLGVGSVLNPGGVGTGTGFSFGSGLGSSSTTGSLNLFGTSATLGNKASTGTSGLNLFTSNPLTTGGFQLQSPPVGKKKR